MTQKYKLIGYISPINSKAGFITPVFEKNDSYFAQQIDENHRVVSFHKIHLDRLDIHDQMGVDYVEVGGNAIYSTQDRNLKVSSGDVHYMKRFLKQNIYDYIDTPFFYRSISTFCEYTLPEYDGCKTTESYLFRKIISNLIPDYTKESKVKLKKIQSNHDSNEVSFGGRNSENSTVLVSKYENISSLYKNFLLFAINKNERIKSERVIKDTIDIDISSEILPSWIDESNTDYRAIRDLMVTLLEERSEKKESYDASTMHYIIQCKNMHTTDNVHLSRKKYEWINSINSRKITSENLSFIIYVTSLISKAARDQLDKFNDIYR